ncbi:hypothetical protein [Virgisporangium aliadipatigenens]|nr:hypothetical protein [Virgisporangium aliadipatigenens]
MEDTLVELLSDSETGAPQPGADFVATVQRRCRRRQRRKAGLVMSAVVLVMSASVFAFWPDAPGTRVTEPNGAWNGKVPDFAAARSPQEVWPKAVQRLPAKLPDGTRYRVVTVLGDQRYLVMRDGPNYNGTKAPEVFDVRTGTTTPLGRPDLYEDARTYSVLEVAAVGERAIWMTVILRPSGQSTELWSAALDGADGPQRVTVMSTRLPPDDLKTWEPTVDIGRFGLGGGMVYWQQITGDKGEQPRWYRIPVSGGHIEVVDGSDRFSEAFPSPWLQKWDSGASGGVGQLWNPATGARVDLRAPKYEHVYCDPFACSGGTDEHRLFVSRHDGTGLKVLPGADSREVLLVPAVEGRFALLMLHTDDGYRLVLWDRVGNTAAVIAGPGGARGAPQRNPYDDIGMGFNNDAVSWPGAQDEMLLLDLTAIG